MAITNNTLVNTVKVPTTNTANVSNTNTQTVATSNPQANIASLQTNNVATTTIPTTQQAVSQPAVQQTYNVPTAVAYTPTTTTANQNTNMYQSVLDNYKSIYGSSTNSSNNYTSKYPQITIPDTNNNTIEGQYKSNYSSAINQLAQSITNMRFSYNPNEDDLLKEASNYATQNTFESMNSKGILNSSMTAERVAQVVGKLIPEYEKMARDEYDSYFTQLLNTANLIMDMDDREFTQWQDARDQQYEEKKFAYQQELDAIENAWQRVDELGYVDNEAALVLGVSVGTLSKDAREAKEEREYQTEEWNRQNEITHKQEIELANLNKDIEKEVYQYKADIDLANNKELYQYQSDVDIDAYQKKSDISLASNKELYQYQSNIDLDQYQKKSDIDLDSYQKQSDIDVNEHQKTTDIDETSTKNLYTYQALLNSLSDDSSSGSSSSGSSSGSTSSGSSTKSLSTYESIIQNRWATKYDNKYIIDDGNNDAVYNYLLTEYSLGNISSSDLSTLSAKYGIEEPGSTSTSTSTSNNANSTLTVDTVNTWIKALDGNNAALNSLGVTIFGQYKSNVNNKDAKNAVYKALEQIQSGEYTFTTSQQLMNDLKNGVFGHLGWGL